MRASRRSTLRWATPGSPLVSALVLLALGTVFDARETSAAISIHEGIVAAPKGTGCPPGTQRIAAGRFPIGTSAMQAYEADEQPRHFVSLTRAYCLDRTELTVEAYARCAAEGRCAQVVPAFVGEGMPMTNVRWRDARDACAFRGGRLPTEVEWEHAARGGDDRLYPWGSWTPWCQYADSMFDMLGHCNGYGPSPVGSFPAGASPYGVLDLAGNVLEWVDDAWDDRAWKNQPDVDPHLSDEGARMHVVRGGSWDNDTVHGLRVSQRDAYPSELADETLGFRCAYDE